MCIYQLYPRSEGMTDELFGVVSCFDAVIDKIDSRKHKLSSNEALKQLEPYLVNQGFIVETGKTRDKKINVPVLFGTNNTIDKSFDADTVSKRGDIVIEVEAGRAVINYQFLKDIFQACMMHNVEYLVLAVRNEYRGNDDFKKIQIFLETLFVSHRMKLPLSGI